MNIPAIPIQDEHDQLAFPEYDSSVTNLTTPNSGHPQIVSTHSRWSKPSPTPQQTSAEPVQSTAYTLITSNLNNAHSFTTTTHPIHNT